MTRDQIYLKKLVLEMQSQGTNNWTEGHMYELCHIAGIWDQFAAAITAEEGYRIVLRAAVILDVEIRHYIPT